jgi:hypothetical protein
LPSRPYFSGSCPAEDPSGTPIAFNQRAEQRITLDAGYHLNKIVSTFTFDGNSPLDLAASIAIHKGGEVTSPVGKSIASV